MSDRKVLLVEDKFDDVELIVKALRGINVHTSMLFVAQDGETALKYIFGNNKARVKSLSFVMLDLKIPKVDGFEVLREIRSDEETRLLPVVVFSSSCDESDIERSYRLGANSYVCKPVEFEQFLGVVKQIGHYWLFCNKTCPVL
ncbi:MAG: response regulator [Syntrophales bacterium]|nr:response regulator [Syntrophales bacterium]